MIFIECSNSRQESILDQDFDSQNGLFAIPHRKVNKVTSLLESIRKEYFQEEQFLTQKQAINKLYLWPNEITELSFKIIELIDGMLKMYLPFSQLRNILNLLHQFHERVMIYALHLGTLQTVLENDNNEDKIGGNISVSYQSEKTQAREILSSSFQNFSHSLQQKIKGYEKSNFISTLPSQHHTEIEDEQDLGLLRSRSKSLSQELKSFNERACFQRYPVDIDNIEQFEENTNLSRLQVERTASSLYCPEWKKEEQEKVKHVKDSLKKKNQVNSESVLNGSNFVQDLSKLVHPIPSAMINDSISEMVKKQEKEDQKKLNIICQSIKGEGRNIKNNDELEYQQKLKKIKLNQKLKNNCNTKNIFQKKKKQESWLESIEGSAFSRLAKHMKK